MANVAAREAHRNRNERTSWKKRNAKKIHADRNGVGKGHRTSRETAHFPAEYPERRSVVKIYLRFNFRKISRSITPEASQQEYLYIHPT